MEKRGQQNKKAQFFLMAAIIIVVIIIGLASVANYIIKKAKPVKFYDLSRELSEESARVIDYGIYNEENIPKTIENFTNEYFIEYKKEKEEETELVFVYGNKVNATMETFTSEAIGEVMLTYGAGGSFVLSGEDRYIANRTILENIGEDEISVEILNRTYNLTLQKGENFLFVIAKKTEEEIYISKS